MIFETKSSTCISVTPVSHYTESERGFYVSLFCCATFCVLFSSAIISLGKRELVGLSLSSSWCCVSVIVLCLFRDDAVGWSLLCDCRISWFYSLTL